MELTDNKMKVCSRKNVSIKLGMPSDSYHTEEVLIYSNRPYTQIREHELKTISNILLEIKSLLYCVCIYNYAPKDSQNYSSHFSCNLFSVKALVVIKNIHRNEITVL